MTTNCKFPNQIKILTAILNAHKRQSNIQLYQSNNWRQDHCSLTVITCSLLRGETIFKYPLPQLSNYKNKKIYIPKKKKNPTIGSIFQKFHLKLTNKK